MKTKSHYAYFIDLGKLFDHDQLLSSLQNKALKVFHMNLWEATYQTGNKVLNIKWYQWTNDIRVRPS